MWRDSSWRECRLLGHADAVDPHWPGDVFDLLFAQIMKRKRKPAAYVIVNSIGQEHPAWLGQSLNSRSDIDAIPVQIVVFDDHVTQIDPNPEVNTIIHLDAGVPSIYCLLDLDRTPHSIDDTGKFDQQAIPCGLDDPSMVLGDFGINEFATQSFEALKGAFFVRPHQPRVTGNISGKDRGETAGLAHST